MAIKVAFMMVSLIAGSSLFALAMAAENVWITIGSLLLIVLGFIPLAYAGGPDNGEEAGHTAHH